MAESGFLGSRSAAGRCGFLLRDVLAEGSFIEQKTLPNVWFSNFNLSQSSSELRLSGEAEDMATLSQQFKVFEDSNDHIKNISVFNSQISSTGRVSFLMNITVLPKIFEYMAPAQPAAPPTNE